MFDTPNGSTVEALEFPQAILSASDVITDKLRNFQFFRANLEVTLKLNSTPFQSGILAIVYEPYYNRLQNFWKYGNKFLASITSYPHEILNLEVSNSVTLSIPYASEYEYFDISRSDTGGFGTITVYALTPFSAATGDNGVEGYVTARFCDMEYYTPTSNTISTTLLSERQKQIELIRRSPVTHQGEQENAAEPGPVTKIAGVIDTVASQLGDVPVIGKFAAPVSWISRGVGKIASIFGWSKPHNLSTTQNVVRTPANGFTHLEGMCDNVMLAAIPDNSIDSSTCIPSIRDEMAINEVCSRSNAIDRFSWSTEDDVGQILFVQSVAPFNPKQMAMDLSQTSTVAGEYSLGAFSYASSFARFWRGALEYTLSLSKTTYHAGRLLVQYYPRSFPTTPSEIADISEVYSLVIDITRKDESSPITNYSITVPYASDLPWSSFMTTKQVDAELPLYLGEMSRACVNGYLVISVYNKLVAPTTVSPYITCLMWHNGGSDYELAKPMAQLEPGTTEVTEIFKTIDVPRSVMTPHNGPTKSPAWTPSITCNGYFWIEGGHSGVDWLRIWAWHLDTGESYRLIYVHGEHQGIEFKPGYGYVVENMLSESSDFPDPDARVYYRFTYGAADEVTWSRVTVPSSPPEHQFSHPSSSLSLFPETTSRDVTPSTTGEYSLKSLRALAKRSEPYRTIVGSEGFTAVPSQINLFDLQSPERFTTPTSLTPSVHALSAMYRFWAGSMRADIHPSQTAVGRFVSCYGEGQATDSAFDTSPTPLTNNAPRHVSYTQVNPVHQVTVPYYSAKKARCIGGRDVDSDVYLSQLQLLEVPTGAHSLYVSAGDDFSTFFLVGPPICKVMGSGVRTIAP